MSFFLSARGQKFQCVFLGLGQIDYKLICNFADFKTARHLLGFDADLRISFSIDDILLTH